ncbi:LCTL [Branchiostoma lanceolatum]|uniref:LCTL protein n=1 Tax=Branchiostoma lanceolatum TaxID=7740 RepID=A0A8J9ZMN1_BRALA|nr:LCTL [Branchiostoma lanceolatum]
MNTGCCLLSFRNYNSDRHIDVDLFLSHASAWHSYDQNFRSVQGGQVSITLSCGWTEPFDPDLPADVIAADRDLQFQMGWFAHPIYTSQGDYPPALKDIILQKSLAQGFQESRLPQFTAAEIASISGTYDFFGLNHYSSGIVKDKVSTGQDPNFWTDQDLESTVAPEWPQAASSWLYSVPWGIHRLIRYIKVK